MSIIRHIYNIGTRAIVLPALCCLAGCTAEEAVRVQPTDGKVAVELALCVSTAQDNSAQAPVAPTRMSSAVVQKDGNFRGIKNLRLIPLNSDDAVCGDMLQGLSRVGGTHHYFTDTLTDLNIGTSQFLCYARAIPAEGAEYADNGSTDDSSFPASHSDIDLNSITFTPVAISPNPENDGYTVTAAKIATYLTSIAIVEGWSSSGYKLGACYKNFVNELNDFKPIAGSTANVKAMLNQLKENIGGITTSTDKEATLKNNILSAIGDDIETKLGSGNYPRDLGLPDGAGALKWNGTAFEVIINAPQGSTMPLSDHDRYAYPPELYYFIKSPIKTSTGQREDDYSKDNWDDVLSAYQANDTTVQSTTRSVAVTKPLDYAVGSMAVSIKADTSELEDNSKEANEAEGPGSTIPIQAVTLGTLGEKKFPLTSIQIDGQYQQTNEFLPVSDTKDDEGNTVKKKEYIVYDKGISGVYLNSNFSSPVYSLAYQSRDAKPVHIVLEFENNSGSAFYGYNNGIVYNGTRFYLIGELWPDGESAVDKERRVFTKDHTTVLNLTIKSLKNAYNVIPDLKTAAYAVHVSNVAIRNWDDLTPVDHELYNW